MVTVKMLKEMIGFEIENMDKVVEGILHRIRYVYEFDYKLDRNHLVRIDLQREWDDEKQTISEFITYWSYEFETWLNHNRGNFDEDSSEWIEELLETIKGLKEIEKGLSK